MTFERFSNPQQFVDQVNPFLMADEAENNLMIGIANRLARSETMDGSVLLSCVLDDSRVVGAAMMTPPYNLILTRAPEQAIRTVAEDIHRGGFNPPGLLAPIEAAELFVTHWRRLTGRSAGLETTMRTHQLTEVVPVAGVLGQARRATEEDAATVVPWFAAFAAETGSIAERPEEVPRHIEAGSLWLWSDREPVSMALAGAVTPNGRRVSGVYTPPDRRRRGYASALVAELSQSILDSGKRFSFLFTDLANPISNSIYARIGYCPVADFAEYRFVPCFGI